jgi:hypothetical protein
MSEFSVFWNKTVNFNLTVDISYEYKETKIICISVSQIYGTADSLPNVLQTLW